MRDNRLDCTKGNDEQDPLRPNISVLRKCGSASLGCKGKVSSLDQLAHVSAAKRQCITEVTVAAPSLSIVILLSDTMKRVRLQR